MARMLSGFPIMRQTLFLSVLSVLGCGDESKLMSGFTDTVPGSGQHPLVGTWHYAGESFTAKMKANVTDHLAGRGVADTTASEIVDEAVDAASIIDLPTITFHADSTLTAGDPAGQMGGTWSVVGDKLHLAIDGEEYPPLTYTVRSGQTQSLQLSISAQVARGLVAASGAIDQALLDVMFRDIVQLTFGYNKTGPL